MRWIAKALLQRGIGVMPRGDAVNYWFQTNVSRNLPRSDDVFGLHVDEALRHAAALREFGSRPIEAAHLYEFGAGWDLIGPLTYWVLGAERQTLVDIRSNLRFPLINQTLNRLFERSKPGGVLSGGRLAEGQAPRPVQTLADLEERFGIRYLAPRDARSSGLPSDSVDFVSSTFTMEHIPRADNQAILCESRRLLKPDGVVSCAIDMKDHYSYFDPKLGPYNFLKFSDRRWKLVNPPLHYQNRMRNSEYRRIFEEAGLEAISERLEGPDQADLAMLGELSIAPRFRRFSKGDLGVRESRVIARPRG